MDKTTIALSIIAAIVFIALIITIVKKSGNGQSGGGGQYGPQLPGRWDRIKAWWARHQTSNPTGRGFVFYTLLLFSAISWVGALLVIQYSAKGNLLLTNGVKVSHVAISLGILLGILSIGWFCYRRPTWVTKLLGGTIAITAVALPFMVVWPRIIASIKKARGINLGIKTDWQQDAILFAQEHGRGTLMAAGVILALVLIIAILRSPGIRNGVGKILLTAAMVLIVCGGAIWVMGKNKPNPDGIGKWVTAKPGATLITVNSETFTAIEYPEGWNWEVAILNPQGEDLAWPTALTIEKSGQRFVYQKAANPRLPDLPLGKDPIKVRVLLPPGTERMEYQLVVIMQKAKTARK